MTTTTAADCPVIHSAHEYNPAWDGTRCSPSLLQPPLKRLKLDLPKDWHWAIGDGGTIFRWDDEGLHALNLADWTTRWSIPQAEFKLGAGRPT